MSINIKEEILKIQPPKNQLEQKPLTIKDLKDYINQLPEVCDNVELLIKEDIHDDKNWTPVKCFGFMNLIERFNGIIDSNTRFMLFYLKPLRPSTSKKE